MPSVIFICFFAVIEIFAEQSVQCIENSCDDVFLRFTLPEYCIKDIVVNGERCQSIMADGGVYLPEKGAPRLPIFTRSIIIPERGAVHLEIVDITCREISVGKIAPSQGDMYRNQYPVSVPYLFGGVYRTDAWYPKEQVSLGIPFILRDFRGVVVSFHPFQYNPISGRLRIAESIAVKVTCGNGCSISPHRKIASSFRELYRQTFINFRQVRYPEIYDGERMIVITAAAYKNSMAPFVAWKNRKGIWTELYEYPSETGGEGTDALKAFIQQQYDTDTISYVLLVGDADDIPSLNGTVAGLSDLSYVKLAGDDHYPDAVIGRFSVEESGHADNIVHKVLQYEQVPDPDGEWYAKAIGMACSEDGGTGVADEEWMEEMCLAMENATYTHIDRIYQSQSNTTDEVNAALNEGRGWFNYQGHGLQKQFGFVNAYVTNDLFKSLTNTGKTPVIVCVACNTGQFDYQQECIAECATRCDSTGAIAFVGSYVPQPWNPPQHGQKEVVRLLTEDVHISFGAMIYNGICKILEVGNSEGNFLETAETWTLFGDPTLLVFNRKPVPMAVTCPEKITTGTQAVTVILDCNIKGRVCLYSEKKGILASSIVSGRDTITMGIALTDEKKIYLTVTARNRIPVMKEIKVGSNAVDESNMVVCTNRFMIKPVGTSLLLHIPRAGKGSIVMTDLQGRYIAGITTTPDKEWYHLPHTLSSGMYIAGITTQERVMTRQFLLVK